jgi:hypothetical protein
MAGSEKSRSTSDAPAQPVRLLRVPKHHVEPLSLLLRAPENQFAAFERELARAERPSSLRGLIIETARRAGWPTPQAADTLAGLLLSLSSIADSMPDMRVDEFVSTVATAAEETGEEQLRASREQWDVLRNRLERLLGPKTRLWLWAKATALFTEQERLFCDARILTDIRPIFDRNAADGPAALSVIHTLKLILHTTSEEVQEFFIALDSDDLLTLKQTIQRAEEKQTALESLIQRTGLPLLLPKTR